ncbi:MAG: hypothetical protein HC872_09190 [Gammaproteobacteria bacterium]|nr:hypothetical protein [Gammaproteobacteria bacterium]
MRGFALAESGPQDSGSELQRRDVRSLLDASVDRVYLEKWAADFGVSDLLQELTA